MGRLERLYAKAKNNPKGLRFSEIKSLAELVGFVHKRNNGDHAIYKHPALKGMMNFQPTGNNQAVEYQVKQLLDYIDENDLI